MKLLSQGIGRTPDHIEFVYPCGSIPSRRRRHEPEGDLRRVLPARPDAAAAEFEPGLLPRRSGRGEARELRGL